MTMLKITKHEFSGARMYLDMSKETMLILNHYHIVSFSYNVNFNNSYGDIFPHMEIALSNGSYIHLYREDAIAAFKKLEELPKASE